MLVSGAMFTFWLGEKITENGVGNGLSLLIFVGILSSAGTSLGSVVKTIIDGNVSKIWELLVFTLTLIAIFAVIVLMDLAERKVPVQYAKQIKGRKMYGGQSTYIPVKVLGTGVMPIIFATAFITFPQMIASVFWPTSAFYSWYATWLGAGSYVYSIVVGLLILFFAYFWNSMVFNPEDISRQIQQNGGFVTGIRAGKPTADYLRKVSNRITIFGAIFLAVLAIIPSILFKAIGGSSLTNAFTATGLIIIVSVALELEKQLDQQIIMRNYRGFLNKRK
jgi:preprotein translocase subunit SecY